MASKFLLGWAVRTVFMLAVGASGIAVLLARSCLVSGQSPEPSCQSLTPTERRYVVIPGSFFRPATDRPSIFDPDTGRLYQIDFPKQDNIMNGSASPWYDHRNGLTLVATWSRRRNDRDGADRYEFGLARYSLPSGKPLNHVVCDSYPRGHACWYPGSTTRALYAASDGLLYSLAFGDEEGSRRAGESAPSPRPLAWRTSRPGAGPWKIADPTWPTDPRLKGKLLVSLTSSSGTTEGVFQAMSQIWWLQLDADGIAIVDAGRLMEPDGDRWEGEPISEGFPSLSAQPDGLALACLTKIPNRMGWQLRFGPLEVLPETGTPRARLGEFAVLADDRSGFRPEFSSDGRWIFSLRSNADTHQSVERHPAGTAP